LLASENIEEYEEKIILRIDEYDFEGHVVLTDYRLIYKPNEKMLKQCFKNPFPHISDDYFDIPIFLFSKMEKSIDRKNPNNFLLEISTKDNRLLRLVCDNNAKRLYGSLALLTNPKDVNNFTLPAIRYREYHPVNNDGWSLYDPLTEFNRQGVYLAAEDGSSSSSSVYALKFRLSSVNKNFDLCMSYPEILIVPKNITDDELREAASFRTKSRIPVLCYYNKENNSSIWRSSQTKSGLTYQRSEKDEKLLQGIYEANMSTNSKKNDKLIIYDARPYLNALANRFKGAGFENTDYYKNAEICFCEIDNIHCVRNAHVKLNQLVTGNKLLENKTFLSNLETTTWTNFIYQIIKSAVDIANSIKKGNSVLIHCSDGWDRSSQLTSLSQILIDPFYRTLEGFMILIEKEWLSFGHQFGLRNGLYNLKDHSEDQRAPIFLQWLDCIHQLLVQFPQMFEFNMNLLLYLAYHLNSCKYGTFLFNSEWERNEKNARNKTVSIWTDILDSKSYFTNPFYISENFINNSNDLNNSGIRQKLKYILPNFAFYKIRFWEEHFLRYQFFANNFSKYYLPFKNVVNKKESLVKRCGIKSNVRSKIKPQTNLQYIEMEKLNDIEVIKKQNEEIEKLSGIIKEISSKLILKVSDYNELSSEAKDIIVEINKGEVVEEDGYVVIKSTNNTNNVK
jgi:hypothetical protein